MIADAKRVCVVLVTFNPASSVVELVNALFTQKAGDVVVIDNTPTPPFFSDFPTTQFCRMPVVISNRENFGIARALNQGCEEAIRRGYRLAITLDQDTKTDCFFITRIVTLYEKLIERDKSIAVLGANYIDRGVGKPAYSVDASNGAIAVKELITSGSLITLDIFTSLSGFEEKLFIDMVDTEYCLRARKAGYSIWRTAAPLMHHSVGNVTICNVGAFRFTLPNHLPQRRYYIFRNTLYVALKYGFFDPMWALGLLFEYLPKLVVKACFFEKKRMANFRYIGLGVWDFLCSRYSRRVL